MVDSTPEVKFNQAVFIKENKANIDDIYEIERKIGAGAFANVYLAKHIVSKEPRAVKFAMKPQRGQSQDHVLKYTEEIRQAKNEIEILKSLDHPNIVKLYEYFDTYKFVFLCQEYVQGGELFDEISRKKSFNEHDAAVLIQQLLSCIGYLHSNNIVHGDIKPENVMLDTRSELNLIKLIDFGTAQIYNKQEPLTIRYGSPYYIAPEVLDDEGYGPEIDVWAVGVIMYILLCGDPPFSGDDDESTLNQIRSTAFEEIKFDLPIWKKISAQAKDLIMKLLKWRPSERLTAHAALKHPWFALNKVDHVELDSKTQSSILDNFKKVHKHNAIKQAALSFLASHLMTKKEKDELTLMFKILDKNGDGKLSKQEVREGYKQKVGLGGKMLQSLTDNQVDHLFGIADTDGSGFIDFNEFVVASCKTSNLLTNDRLLTVFKMFDQDGSGKISYSEVAEVLGGSNSVLTKAQLTKIVEEADKGTRDGQISFEEFAQIMRNNAM